MTVRIDVETIGQPAHRWFYANKDGDAWTIEFPSGQWHPAPESAVLNTLVNALRTPATVRVLVDGCPLALVEV